MHQNLNPEILIREAADEALQHGRHAYTWREAAKLLRELRRHDAVLYRATNACDDCCGIFLHEQRQLRALTPGGVAPQPHAPVAQ